MTWELMDAKNVVVTPRQYSNGKTQDSVVNESIDALQNNKFIVIIGGVGTGKSAIALHIVKHFGSGIIVVPTKVLEHQYQDDYCGAKKYHLPGLDVEYMVGKGNFRCKYVNDRWSCTHSDEPCNRPLNKKPNSENEEDNVYKGETRLMAASICQYWSPVYPMHTEKTVRQYLLSHTHSALPYTSISGEKLWFAADCPCEYYRQFSYYTKACALLMNAAKWEIETYIGRKPAVPIEIIDEGDEFLDSLSYQVRLDEKFFRALRKENEINARDLDMLEQAFLDILRDNEGYEGKLDNETVLFINNFQESLKECSSSSVAFDKLSKLTRIAENVQFAYVFVRHDALTVFMPRPDITLQKIFANSQRIVLMSATMQSRQTLKDIFGIEPCIIIAEDHSPGTLKIKMTGRESMVTYRTWQDPEYQKQYHDTLNHIVQIAHRPTLVQVHAKKYVPLQHQRDLENEGFVDGVWWSTKTDRGVDLPDDTCRAIVLMKYPMPDMNDVVLKTMRSLLGEGKFWMYMNDIATRNLVQQCGRGLRHNDDWCEVWSPDSKCLAMLQRVWNGKKTVENAAVGKTLRELKAMREHR